jgi:hypothetical protein
MEQRQIDEKTSAFVTMRRRFQGGAHRYSKDILH